MKSVQCGGSSVGTARVRRARGWGCDDLASEADKDQWRAMVKADPLTATYLRSLQRMHCRSLNAQRMLEATRKAGKAQINEHPFTGWLSIVLDRYPLSVNGTNHFLIRLWHATSWLYMTTSEDPLSDWMKTLQSQTCTSVFVCGGEGGCLDGCESFCGCWKSSQCS